MAFGYRHKSPAAGGAHFSARRQCPLDRSAIGFRFCHARGKKYRTIRRRRSEQLNRVIGGYGAGRMIFVRLLHEVVRSGPVTMAIEQRADDSAVQNAGERFILRLRLPLGHDRVTFGKAADAQALRVRRPAAPTGIVRRVAFLERWPFLCHNRAPSG